jgi:hypothetical protein
MPSRRTARTITVLPTVGSGAPFAISLELELTRCPECAVDNVPRRLRGSVHTAVRRAIRPDGA